MARKAKQQIHGTYNELGYQVFRGDKQLRFALNHIHDSYAYAEPGSEDAVPVEELKRFCERACEEECRAAGLASWSATYENWQ